MLRILFFLSVGVFLSLTVFGQSANTELSYTDYTTSIPTLSSSTGDPYSKPRKFAPADPCQEYILSTTNIIRDTTINGNTNLRAIYQGHFLGCNYDSITYDQDWYTVAEYGFGNGPDWNPQYYNFSRTSIKHAGCTWEYDTIITQQNWISRRINTNVYFDNTTVIQCDTIFEDFSFTCDSINAIQYTKDPTSNAIVVFINSEVPLEEITTERPFQTITHTPQEVTDGWYSITVSSCEQFEMNITLPDSTTCGPVFIYSPCTDFPEEDPDALCQTFEFEVIKLPVEVDIPGIFDDTIHNYCTVLWNSQEEIQNSQVTYSNNNLVGDNVFNSLKGAFHVPSGESISLSYSIASDPQDIPCDTTFTVDCDTITAVEIEDYCSEFNYSVERLTDNSCLFSYTINPHYYTNVSIEYANNLYSFSASEGSHILRIDEGEAIDIQINALIIYPDPDEGETFFSNCTFSETSCSSGNEPTTSLSIICDIFQSLEVSSADDQSLLISSLLDIDNYLQSQGISRDDLFLAMDNVEKIEINTTCYDRNDVSTGNMVSVLFGDDNVSPYQFARSSDSSIPGGQNPTYNFDYTEIIENWAVEEEVSISELLTCGIYFTIYTADSSWNCDLQYVNIDEETYLEPDPIPYGNLPIFDCNTSVDTSLPNDTTDLLTASVGDIFYVYGFPMQLSSVDVRGPGLFAGSGVIPLPFSSKFILVDFTNLRVNSDKIVFNGQIEATSGQLNSLSNINYPPLNFGGDICLPPPPPEGYMPGNIDPVTGLDPYGFDPLTGQHSNGTNYDDNGFDFNGDHYSTNTPYDENGCDRDGLDKDGIPCDPAPVNPAINPFIDSVGPGIIGVLDSILQTKRTEFQLELAGLDCGSFRTTIGGLVQELGFNQDYIYGLNNEYIDPGLSDNFIHEPKEMEFEFDRDARVMLLEQNHVNLYHCDKDEIRLTEGIQLIDSLLGGDLEFAREAIIEAIENWSDYQVSRFLEDSEAFIDWMKAELEAILESNGYEVDLVFLDELPVKNYFNNPLYEINDVSFGQVASSSGFSLSTRADFINEYNFHLDQGFKEINGIHRAYFLEAIINQNESTSNSQTGVSALPIRINKQVGSKLYQVMIDNLKISPTSGATCDAFIIITDPESGRKLVFEGFNIGFNPDGSSANSRLSLANDVELRINNNSMLRVMQGDSTFVDWDCEGFIGMGIDGEIEFCRNYIVPLDQSGTPKPGDERYKLAFKALMEGWLDFTLEVNAGHFALANYEQIQMRLDRMVIDLSEKSNHSDVVFPNNYLQQEGSVGPEWKGFYIKNFDIQLPNKFSKDSTSVVQISAHNLLIDKFGVSGEASSPNTLTLLGLDQGSLSGWPFSINGLGVNILHNHVVGFNFAGNLQIPLFSDTLNYTARLYPNDQYSFEVEPQQEMTSDMLVANVTLKQPTSVSVNYKDNDFWVTADLYGKLQSTIGTNDLSLDLPEIEFEGVRLSNKAPYFDAGSWSLPTLSGADFSGFPLSISQPRLYQPDPSDNTTAGLLLRVELNLNNEYSVNAVGHIGIAGRLIELNGQQKWIYEDVEVKQFCLDGSFQGVESINGCLHWFKEGDPGNNGFGKGFKGSLDVQFEKFLDQLVAIGQFGKVGGYNYFFVDASATLEKGIPMGALELKGFRGGVSYAMNTTFNPSLINFEVQVDTATLSPLGQGLSGFIYTPSNGVGLGLKAGAIFNLNGKKNLFNGSVTLGINFNQKSNNGAGGGLSSMGLYGLGQLMTPTNPATGLIDSTSTDESAEPTLNAALKAYVRLNMDFDNDVFTGNLGAFLNAGLLKGDSTNNALVQGNLRFARDGWFINMGTPKSPATAQLTLFEGSDTRLQLKSYFNVGTQIPDFPEIPRNVRKIATKVKSNESLRKSGGGVMFGASAEASAHVSILGIASASADAGVGFDIMIKDYGETFCVDNPNEQIGIAGWYAAGQMWAFVQGELKAFGINVISMGLAAALQARLPNPSWIQGSVGVKIKTFLFSLRKSMKIEFGETCTFVTESDSPLGMDVISFVEPGDDVRGIPVDVYPKVYLNVPLDKQFTRDALNGKVTGTVNVKSLEVQVGGISYPVDYEIDPENNSIFTYDLPYFLPPDTMVTLITTIEGDMVDASGHDYIEERDTVQFRTLGTYDHIPESNIQNSYPINGMNNYYINEYSGKNFIHLKKSMPDLLFSNQSGLLMKLEDTNGSISEVPVTIDDPKTISYSLKGLLSPSTGYKLQLYQRQKNNNLGGNNSVVRIEDQVLYTLFFRTSSFLKFRDKVNALDNSSLQNFPLLEGLWWTGQKSVAEGFDRVEIEQNLVDAYFDRPFDYPNGNVNVLYDFYRNNFDYYEENDQESVLDRLGVLVLHNSTRFSESEFTSKEISSRSGDMQFFPALALAQIFHQMQFHAHVSTAIGGNQNGEEPPPTIPPVSGGETDNGGVVPSPNGHQPLESGVPFRTILTYKIPGIPSPLLSQGSVYWTKP